MRQPQIATEARAAFYGKLLKVQMELGKVKKNAKNPFFKSDFADLNECLQHVMPVLNKHGLYVQQGNTVINTQQGAKDAVYTKVIDVDSGVSEESVMMLEDCKGDMQKKGGAATYCRRYTLKSLFCIEDADDDGNTATGKRPNKKAVAAKDVF